MNIKLKSLRFKNFKGIKDLKIDFGQETNIYGENESGKTTIFDGFRWLFFDKDSADRSSFSIKTLDSNNQVIHGLEHEVEGLLVVNGTDLKLTKVYKEKWTKKHGEAERLLTGHETLYSIDDVPVKKNEYVAKIQSLIDENVFKLVTNPLHFNENIKWTDRLEILMQVIGEIDDNSIVASNQKLKPLQEILSGKSIDDFKKMVAAQKKRLNDEIKSVPIRIDEINNSLPTLRDINFEEIETNLNIIHKEISDIELQVADQSEAYKEIAKQKESMYAKQSELKMMEYQAGLEKDKPLKDLQHELANLKSDILDLENSIRSLKSNEAELLKRIDSANKEIQSKREQWHIVNSKTLEFDEHQFICPTCNRGFDEGDIDKKKEELNQTFIKNKVKELEKITNEGTAYSNKLKEYQEQLELNKVDLQKAKDNLSNSEKAKEQLEHKISNFEPVNTLDTNKEYQALKQEVSELETALTDITLDEVVKELQAKKLEKIKELDELKTKLAIKEQYERSKKRIAELLQREKELAQQIAELEGQEYLCEEFIRTKVSLLESRINSKFSKVRFKLFNTLVNGAIEECCEVLVDGVPYQDVNNAGKVFAGIDIINTLSEHFGVSAPIFIDNREGVNELPGTVAQLVNLIVKDLRTQKKLEAFKAVHPDVIEVQGAKNKLYMEVA